MKIYEVRYELHNHGKYEDHYSDRGVISIHKTKEGALRKIENIGKEDHLKVFSDINDVYVLSTIDIDDADENDDDDQRMSEIIRNFKTYEESEEKDYWAYDMRAITTNYYIYEMELED